MATSSAASTRGASAASEGGRMNLAGAKVLLTGAGSGIGLATATRLARAGRNAGAGRTRRRPPREGGGRGNPGWRQGNDHRVRPRRAGRRPRHACVARPRCAGRPRSAGEQRGDLELLRPGRRGSRPHRTHHAHQPRRADAAGACRPSGDARATLGPHRQRRIGVRVDRVRVLLRATRRASSGCADSRRRCAANLPTRASASRTSPRAACAPR